MFKSAIDTFMGKSFKKEENGKADVSSTYNEMSLSMHMSGGSYTLSVSNRKRKWGGILGFTGPAAMTQGMQTCIGAALDGASFCPGKSYGFRFNMKARGLGSTWLRGGGSTWLWQPSNSSKSRGAGKPAPCRPIVLERLGENVTEKGSEFQVLQAPSTMPSPSVSIECECWSTSRKPMATILSLVAGVSTEYKNVLRQNRALEANKFGYEYCEFSHTFDETRAPAWSKILAMEELMRRGRETLIWMDADAYFVTLKSFEDITQVHFDQGKDIVFTDDTGGRPVNSGVFVTRNSPWSKAFWKSVYDVPNPRRRVKTARWHDQAGIYKYRNDKRDDFDRHVAIIPRHIMNSLNGDAPDFIVHQAGSRGSHDVGKYDALLQKGINANSALTKQTRISAGFFTEWASTEQFFVHF